MRVYVTNYVIRYVTDVLSAHRRLVRCGGRRPMPYIFYNPSMGHRVDDHISVNTFKPPLSYL